MPWHIQKIPKTAYFYWANDVMPWIRYLTLETFRFHNPDWKIVIYTNQQVNVNETVENYWSAVQKLTNVQIEVPIPIEEIFQIDISHTPDDHFRNVYRSDFLRWYLLHEVGGLWSDMDILYVKPIEDMFWNIPEYKTCETIVLPVPYNNFILSARGSQLAEALYTGARQISQADILLDPFTTGPVHYERIRGGRVKESQAKYDYVLEIPITTTEIADDSGHDYDKVSQIIVPTETVGIHWHGSGKLDKYTHIDLATYQTDQTLLGHLLRYALEQMDTTCK